MWIHNEYIQAFDLDHGLILCVSEGLLFELLCIHIEGMETFDLHELILYVSEGVIYELLCIHTVNIHGISRPY